MNGATSEDDARRQEFVNLIADSYILHEVSVVDKRYLPCVHVLCGNCEAVRSRSGQKPGDTIGCKVCQLQLELPASEASVDKIARKLKDLSVLLQQKIILCEECEEKEHPERLASKFCETCTSARNLCYECPRLHAQNGHKTFDLLSHLITDAESYRVRPTCYRHSGRKRLEICCAACQSTGCVLCLVELCETFPEAKNMLQQAFGKNCQAFRDATENAKEIAKTYKTEMEAIENAEKMVKKQIGEAAKTFKRKIDEERRQLEEELTSKSKKKIRQLQFDLQRLEKDVIAVNYHLSFDPAKASTMSPVDAFCKLNEIRKATHDMNQIRNTTETPQPVKLTFKRSDDFERLQSENIIGEISEGPPSDTRSVNDHDSGSRIYEAEKNAAASVILDLEKSMPPARPHLSSEQEGRTVTAVETLQKFIASEDLEAQNHPVAKYLKLIDLLKNRIIDGMRRKDLKNSFLRIEGIDYLKATFNSLVSHEREMHHDRRLLADIEKLHQEVLTACRKSLSLSDNRSSKLHEETIDKLNQLEDLLQQHCDQQKPEGRTLEVSRPGVTPLDNIGNTCFINVLIQILCNTDVFLDLLHQRFPAGESSRRSTTGNELTTEFLTLCTEMSERRVLNKLKASVHSSDIYNPVAFVIALNMQLQKFEIGRQHDSHELFILLLNKLRQEEKENPVPRDSSLLATAVDRVFTGRTLTVYVCGKCMTPYHLCEPFLSLSLPVIAEKDEVQSNFHDEVIKGLSIGVEYSKAIFEALVPVATFSGDNTTPVRSELCLTKSMRYYTRFENIQDEYLCTKCQSNDAGGSHLTRKPKLTSAVKRTLIFDPPPVLVIHLKRFQQLSGVGNFTKIDEHVNYDFFLDLAPFTSSGAMNVDVESGNIWYELYGVVIHMGTLSFGHYYAYVKVRGSNPYAVKKIFERKCRGRKFSLDKEAIIEVMKKLPRSSFEKKYKPILSPGVWYRLSDSDCREVKNDSDILNQDAFMLFYDRVDYRATKSLYV